MSVKIIHIEDSPCDLYDPTGNLVGCINTNLELNYVRIQIKNQKLEGYYVIWDNQKLTISSDGKMSSWPQGFFDTLDIQLDTLIN